MRKRSRYTKAQLAGQARIPELTKLAEHHHRQAAQKLGEWLEHVRKAGDAFREVYRIQGRRRKWTRWREAHFPGQRETIKVYMRIANHWSDPRLTIARARGEPLSSIRSVLRIISGKGQPLEPLPRRHDWQRRGIINMILTNLRDELKLLHDDELGLLLMDFAKCCWTPTAANLKVHMRLPRWARFQPPQPGSVDLEYEDPPFDDLDLLEYDPDLNQQEADVRQRLRRAYDRPEQGSNGA